MKNVLRYKEWVARIDLEPYENVFVGRVLAINHDVSFSGSNVLILKKAFAKAIDDYLEDCRVNDELPEKPYRGEFNIMLSQNIHRKIAIASAYKNMSLDDFIRYAIEYTLANSKDRFWKILGINE
jgi:predicted HicB family RNase H-like nuclease